MCAVASSRLLKNVDIQNRINFILNEMMTDSIIDAEIMHVIKQRTDYGAKIRAIDQYNKLKKRINGDPAPSGGSVVILLPKKEQDRIKSLLGR